MDFHGVLIRDVLFPLMERFKGNRIREYMSELSRTQYYDPDKLLDLQREKLEKLLLHCLDKVEFYKKYSHLKKEVSADPFTALRKFPVLDKKTFRQHFNSFIADGLDAGSLIPNKTGGSTGEPVHFYMDRKTVEYYEAARWRGLSWWGIRPGDKCAMLWGAPVDLDRYGRLKYRLTERLLKNRIILPSTTIRKELMRQHLERLNRFKPLYLYGYATPMHLFAKYMLEEELTLSFKPKAVVTTAEMLFDGQRHDIRKAFNCEVVNEYGARDGGILAYQCPRGNMHVTAENAVLEMVDLRSGEPVTPGSTGAVLVTDLNNFSMPRLRYVLGDAASYSGEKCSCSLGLPVLKDLQGRVDELLVTKSGSLVSGQLVNNMVRNARGLDKYRLTQHTPESATIEIVKNEAFSDSEIESLINGICDALEGINISVKYVEDIAPGPSGKQRYIVRQFPLN
jgi:phenylacetate-CoA ligase